MQKKIGIAVAVCILLVGSAYGLIRYYYNCYPFGMDHRCDKGLYMILVEYAQKHGGAFPAGQRTPEASLSLIHSRDGFDGQYAYLLRHRNVREDVVREMLFRGELLGPETCGWNYVEGLRFDSNGTLALFWDKEELDEMGGRLPEGGHMVTFAHGTSEYIPESRWDDFIKEQRQLLTEERKYNHDLPERPAALYPRQ